jgi:hypothetical protein
MTATPPLVRFSALVAPTLLLLYGLLRLIDGLDGDHGPALAWNLGHTLFFIAFVLFGVLIVGCGGSFRPPRGGREPSRPWPRSPACSVLSASSG